MIFIKEQQASRLFSSFKLKTALSKLLVLGNILSQRYKINEIIITFLLAGDTFLPEIRLRQPGLTCNASGHFTKNKEHIQKFKETADSKYLY